MEIPSKKNAFFNFALGKNARRLRFPAQFETVRKIFEALCNLDQHIKLSRTMTIAGISSDVDFHKGMRYRYLRRYYLGGGLSVSQRLRVAINHYQTIARHFRPEFLITSASHGYVLWRRSTINLDVKITLRFPYPYNFDGDMCLVLAINEKDAYIMTFSFAEWGVTGAEESEVIMISGIQGIAGRLEDIRNVTESCNNVAPAQLLLFCAESMVAAIGVKALVGVGRSRAFDERAPSDSPRLFDYDAFWMPIAGVDEASEFYRVPLPFVDKPIEAIPAKHRGRARQRRELRNIIRKEISIQTNLSLCTYCLKEAFSANATYTSNGYSQI